MSYRLGDALEKHMTLKDLLLAEGLSSAGYDAFIGLTGSGDFVMTAGDQTIAGIKTFSGTLKMTASITKFDIDGTLAGNSDAYLPTQRAAKTYVDTQISAHTQAAAKGGTGIDSSGSTGMPKVTAGVWSIDATLDNLADGATYGKVKISALTAGEVTTMTDAGGDNLTIALNGANRAFSLGDPQALAGNVLLGDGTKWATSTKDAAGIVATSGAQVIGGAKTFSTSIQMGSGAIISEFSTDGTFADNSDIKLPTQKAIKSYVDGKTIAGAKGGTGIDSSGSTGMPKVTAGVWSIDATLDNLADGATYGKVKISALTAGEVTTMTDAGGDNLTIALNGANRALSLGDPQALAGNVLLGDGTKWATSTKDAAGIVATSGTQVIGGAKTFSTSIQMGAGAIISEFSTDGTFADNSDLKLPTQKAIKSYVDGKTIAGAKGGTGLDTTGLTGIAAVAAGIWSIASPDAQGLVDKASVQTIAGVKTFVGITMVTAINEFSTDGTLAGDSDAAVPTERAVKAYVDGKSITAANGGTGINTSASTGFPKVAGGTWSIGTADAQGLVSKADVQTISGVKTFSGGITMGAAVTLFSIDGTLVGNSDASICTEKAIKTYVDGKTIAGAKGGTGQDTTGVSGIPLVTAGVWSFAASMEDIPNGATYKKIKIGTVDYTNLNVLVADGTDYESVTPDAGGLVAKTGAQTIAGAKSFSDAMLSKVSLNYALATNVNNDYSAAVAITGLTDGAHVVFKCPAASLGAATLNVNALGAKKLLLGSDSVTQITNQLVAGGIYDCYFSTSLDPANGAWAVMNL